MFCPQCGLKNPEGAKFCFSCGTKLRAVPSAPPVAAPKSAERPLGKHAAPGTLAVPSDPAVAPASEQVSAFTAPADSAGVGAPVQAGAGEGEPSLKELAQDTASTVVHAATSLHNINVQGKCLLWGALYTIGGFSIFFSGDAASDEKLPLLLLIVYGIWLLVGGFTGGWRLVIY